MGKLSKRKNGENKAKEEITKKIGRGKRKREEKEKEKKRGKGKEDSKVPSMVGEGMWKCPHKS